MEQVGIKSGSSWFFKWDVLVVQICLQNMAKKIWDESVKKLTKWSWHGISWLYTFATLTRCPHWTVLDHVNFKPAYTFYYTYTPSKFNVSTCASQHVLQRMITTIEKSAFYLKPLLDMCSAAAESKCMHYTYRHIFQFILISHGVRPQTKRENIMTAI